MATKPKLLIYAASWNEKRNLIFSHYLSNYFDIIVLTSYDCDKKIIELASPAKIISIKNFLRKKVGLSFSLEFKKYISEHIPTFIMTIETHSISSYQSIRLAKRFNFKTVIFSWQNVSTMPKYFFQRTIQKKVLNSADFLLAGTTGTKNYLLEKRANSDKIFVNPETGYDETIFNTNNSNLRESWGFNKDQFLVMYAGRLLAEKGIKEILTTAKKIEKINDKIKFIFVGKGNMEKSIGSLGSKNVVYKSFYDFTDMGKVLRSCDLFVYPSKTTKYWTEQFGYSVIEAQACGKPVIVSNSGFLPSLVNDEINGSIIKEGDENGLSEKIIFWADKMKRYNGIFQDSVFKFSGKNIALNYKKILIDNDPSLQKDWL